VRPNLMRLILPLLVVLSGTTLVLTEAAPAEAADCPTARIYGVRGSGEKANDSGGYGGTVAEVVSGVIQANPGATAEPIDYPAVPIGYGGVNYGTEYDRSVQAGRVKLATTINRWWTGPCGSVSPILLVGYSQGAQVAADVYQGWLLPRVKARVLGITLLADPRFRGGQATPVNRGTYDRRLNGVYDIPGTPRTWAASESGVARSYCTWGDPVCNVTWNSLAACRLKANSCPHASYGYMPSWQDPYTAQAARWLVGRLPAVPVTDKTLTVGPLTMRYPASKWSDVDYGASGPGQDSNANDLTNDATCGDCDQVPPPQIHAFVQVVSMTWCEGSISTCAVGDSRILSEAPRSLSVAEAQTSRRGIWRAGE
jgi:hypothetical protein